MSYISTYVTVKKVSVYSFVRRTQIRGIFTAVLLLGHRLMHQVIIMTSRL